MMRDLKHNYFKYVVGHAHAGTMIHLATHFGGKTIKKFPHWYGSRQTHYLYEVDLSKTPVFVDVPRLKQKTFYDCGIASLAVLRGMNDVIVLDNKKWGISKRIGVSHEAMMRISDDVFIHKLQAKYDSSIYDIEKLIDKYHPVIVNYQYQGEGHYSVVCGYDKENVYIMNVYRAKIDKVKKERFLKSWYSKYYGFRWMAF